MTLKIRCKRCGETIAAPDEDDLLRQVQDHARDHGGAHGDHAPSPEHVLDHLHTPGHNKPEK